LIMPSRSARSAAMGLGREQHLLHHRQRHVVEERQHTRNIVGDAELGGRDGEGRVGRRDQEVAGHRQLARPAPHAALDQRDHRRRKRLHRAHQNAQRIVPTERIAPHVRQLRHIVPRRPDLATLRRPNDQRPDLIRLERLQPGEDLIDQPPAQRVPLLRMIDDENADLVVALALDLHGDCSPVWFARSLAA
jgi:hypothetical protein